MNYIELINVFWKLDAEHSFNGNETRLYFYLLNLSNSLRWKNPLTNADGHTASMVAISVNTLKSVRNRLQQLGLINFKPGGKGSRNKCQYFIVPPAQVLRNNAVKVSEFDTLLNDSLTPYLIPGMGNYDDISKHKPDKTDIPIKNAHLKKIFEPREESTGPGLSQSGFFSDNLDKGLSLNETQVETTIEFIRLKCDGRMITSGEVEKQWEAFKILQFEQRKWYNDIGDLLSHFRQSLKIEIQKVNGNHRKNNGPASKNNSHRAVITGAATGAGTI